MTDDVVVAGDDGRFTIAAVIPELGDVEVSVATTTCGEEPGQCQSGPRRRSTSVATGSGPSAPFGRGRPDGGPRLRPARVRSGACSDLLPARCRSRIGLLAL